MKTITIEINDKTAAAIEGIAAVFAALGYGKKRMEMNLFKRGVEKELEIIMTGTSPEVMKIYEKVMAEHEFANNKDLMSMNTYLSKG